MAGRRRQPLPKPRRQQRPAPSPHHLQQANEVIFGLFELYSGYTWIFEWMLMGAIIGEDFYPCDTNAIISTSADTVAPNPAFPDKDIGPFESHGIEGCSLRRATMTMM
jgi:hypothetical protein